MDNSVVIDGAIAIALLAGMLIGAKLFKSLMGFVVVIAAFIGAVLLADLLTGPVTDAIAPRVEEAVMSRFSDELERSAENGAYTDELLGLLERYGASDEMLDWLRELSGSEWFGAARERIERMADAFRAAVSSSTRALVAGTVHALLVLALYLVLLVALKLLVRALDLVFDLPVLNTLNGVGGALFGLAEAAVLVYLAVFAAARLGAADTFARASNARLLPYFLDYSPFGLVPVKNVSVTQWRIDEYAATALFQM